MPNTNDFDIAIIGDGITGLSAAYHLQKLGYSKLCIYSKEPEKSMTASAAGFLSGGLLDNYTRISHQHGRVLARALWAFADQAYDALVKFCSEQGIDYSQGPKFRWSISAHEANEALQAIAQLQDDGFKVSWLPSINGRHANFGPLLKGCQKEERAATVNVQELMQKLRQSIGSIANKGPALNLFQHKEGCIIESTEGQCRSELVICAAHLSIEHFIPELKNTLVSVADQWSEFELADSGLTWPWRTGTNFSWQHGYQWGVLNSSRSLRLGGGRFMRPLAGIEATSAVKEAKISSFLQESWHLLWPHLPLRPTGLGMAGLDFRPCDELPIIGPMFGQNRILVATGFMGQGLTLGFLGGRCLAEIIAGLPSHLPRFLWPERLRSLT